MPSDTKLANDVINRNLLGAAVESFGVSHQILFLDFRDKLTDDHRLSIDTEITSNNTSFDNRGLTDEERALLLLNSVNLQRIINIKCDKKGGLTIQFENAVTLFFSGNPRDKTCIEPWQIGSCDLPIDADGYLVISMYGSSYAVWDKKSSAPGRELFPS